MPRRRVVLVVSGSEMTHRVLRAWIRGHGIDTEHAFTTFQAVQELGRPARWVLFIDGDLLAQPGWQEILELWPRVPVIATNGSRRAADQRNAGSSRIAFVDPFDLEQVVVAIRKAFGIRSKSARDAQRVDRDKRSTEDSPAA